MSPRLVSPLALLLGLLTLAACNGLAGISDFHEVDQFPSDGSSQEGGANDAGGADAGDAGSASGVVVADAADGALPPPACDATQLALQITVIASPTNAFVGVDIHFPALGGVQAGDTRTICLAPGTAVDLRANPDKHGALHKWDGTNCGTIDRCAFTLTTNVVATVHLQ